MQANMRRYTAHHRKATTLDDLPGDRCRVACILLQMLRRSRMLAVRDVDYPFATAARDLADCSMVRLMRGRSGEHRLIALEEVRCR